MNNQEIFKSLGPKWKWASLSSSGTARVHSTPPEIKDGVVCYKLGEGTDRASAFDILELPPEGLGPLIWERTDFTNGPSYDTDKFGIPLAPVMPPEAGVPYCTEGPQLPAGHASGDFGRRVEPQNLLTLCTVKGCEHAKAANAKYCVAHSAPDGGPLPIPPTLPDGWSDCRIATPVLPMDTLVDLMMADGRTVWNISLGAKDWGSAVAYRVVNSTAPAPGLREDGSDVAPDDNSPTQAQMDNLNELLNERDEQIDKFKTNARYLLNCLESNDKRAVLTPAIYLAIFGEQPH